MVSGLGVPLPLALYWNFATQADRTVYDVSGNGNHCLNMLDQRLQWARPQVYDGHLRVAANQMLAVPTAPLVAGQVDWSWCAWAFIPSPATFPIQLATFGENVTTANYQVTLTYANQTSLVAAIAGGDTISQTLGTQGGERGKGEGGRGAASFGFVLVSVGVTCCLTLGPLAGCACRR